MRWLLWLCVLFCGCDAVASEAAKVGMPMQLSLKQSKFALSAHASFVIVPQGQVSWKEVRGATWQARFRPFVKRNVEPIEAKRRVGDRKSLWLRWSVRLKRSMPRHTFWVLYPASMSEKPAQLYWHDAASKKRGQIIGFSPSKDLDKTLRFPMERPSGGGELVLYARFDGVYSMRWMLRFAALWKADAYLYRRRTITSMVGAYIGFMLLIIIASFFFFLFVRDRSYLWYTLFQSALLLYMFLAMPLGFWFVHETWLSPSLHRTLMNAMLGVFVCLNALFGRSFLETKEHAPAVEKVFWALFVLGALYVVTVPFRWGDLGLPRLMGLIAPLVVFFAGWTRWRQGYRPAIFYLLGQSLFALGGCLMVLESFGWLASFSLGLYWLLLGSTLEAIFLSLALIDRVRVARGERSQLERARQTAEHRAQKHEQRLALILDAVKGGVWDWDIERGEFYMSPAFLERHGYDPVVWDFSPGHWMGQIHPDDTNGLLAAIQAYAARDEDAQDVAFDVEFRFKTKDGWRWILFQGRIVERGDMGIAHRMVGTFIDVTERKFSQDKMQRADKMASLGQLMAGIAHEINNPNNFITFNLPLLKDALQALEPAMEEYAEENPGWRILHRSYDEFLEQTYQLIDSMKYGSERISTLVSELKTFVRSQKKHKDRRQASIAQVVEKVNTLIGKQMQQMVQHFSIDIEEELPMLEINIGKIEQVLLNLLINAGQAAEATEEDESRVSLCITHDAPAKEILIEVTDNGPGIDPEHINKLFDPFFTTKATNVGTGLGLSISHQIIEDHGGSISFVDLGREAGESVQAVDGDGDTADGISCGARFSVRLPTHATPSSIM